MRGSNPARGAERVGTHGSPTSPLLPRRARITRSRPPGRRSRPPAATACARVTAKAAHARPHRHTDETWRPLGLQNRGERVRFLPSVSTSVPRSSSRTGCRSLTPAMRVRVPPGVSRDRGVRSEAHGVASAADRVRSPAVALVGLLVARMVACTHPSGVRFPGAPPSCSRTRLGARPGCLPGEGGFDSRRER
jgi:hypothetical protein